MKTTKEEILKQISKLEDEIQILRKKAENIDPKVEVWDDLPEINGYYIERESEIVEITDMYNDSTNLNVFKTKKHAKKALAVAQISQLMPYYGGEITDDEWNNNDLVKYVIRRSENRIERGVYNYVYFFLAFHTEEQRESFLLNNEQLVRDYLMID